jgi:DNA modification methylase
MVKSNPIPSKHRHFMSDVEYIIIIREKGSYFANDALFDDYRKVFFTKSVQNNIHPAQKPIDVMKKYIRVLSASGDLVLDAFMGSGTTGLACQQLNRNYVGFEIDKQFCTTTVAQVPIIHKHRKLSDYDDKSIEKEKL